MKNIVKLLIISICLITIPVFASNDVDYTLTITDDYKFEEVIKYKLTDYKKVVGGNNPFYSLIKNDKIEADILNSTYYTKHGTEDNGTYNLTLSKTYSEYGFSNALKMNTCFENSNYEYDVDKISFKTTGRFRCLDADNLTINVITNFPIIATDAKEANNNKYTWYPENNKFTMNISFEKKYKTPEENNTVKPTDNIVIDNNDNNNSENNNSNSNNQNKEQKQEKSVNIYLILSIVGIIILISLIVILILNQRKKNINEI